MSGGIFPSVFSGVLLRTISIGNLFFSILAFAIWLYKYWKPENVKILTKRPIKYASRHLIKSWASPDLTRKEKRKAILERDAIILQIAKIVNHFTSFTFY
jgi:hypothetical protein